MDNDVTNFKYIEFVFYIFQHANLKLQIPMVSKGSNTILKHATP
jgi:hypothetical protein